DSACNVTCNSNSCDTNNRKWCNKGVWDEREYCVKCGQVDSSCSVTCQENKCDTENKKRCYKGRWNSTTYCDFCKGYDFSCGEICRSGTCDNVANKWCNSGTWDSLDYCDRCQDSECLDLCSYNACDQNAKKWCNSGTWDYIGYCQKCGRVDSTCQAICSENKCDVASNKICRNEDWTSDDYCNSCSLFDLDCTLTCAEGQCDVATKKVCKEGKWTEDSYCDSCAEKDTSCKPPCLLGEDGCCSGEADGICDPDCTAAEDEDCDDIECRADGSCILGNRCGNDVDCLSNLCLNDICEELKCDNNIQDGKESDIDCGGNCEGCKLGQICSWSSDCLYELSCTRGQCSEKDSDSDGILDKWEKENGLDPEDPLDAQMDFDEDGLTNLMEYTYGTNPNNADSDGDGASDKEEIDEGTDPLDPVSKPGGIGGLLFWTVISVIIFAAGSYVFHYYKDYFIKPKASKSTSTSEYMPQTPYEPQTSISNKILEEERIHEIVKERRKKKEEKRAKLLEPFGKRGKNKKPLLSIREGQESKLHKTHTANKKEKKKDVFSKLKLLSKKGKK
ncbi:MAG: hypothetical protein IIB81_01525, partial [Nanoarchaeota archaeon]|nr:hypothetical protein [Nanoarchaeota archaeon]